MTLLDRYGASIRKRSKLIRSMRENKEKQERRKKRAEDKFKRRAEAEVEAGAAMETGAAVTEVVDIEKDLEKGESEKTSSQSSKVQ